MSDMFGGAPPPPQNPPARRARAPRAKAPPADAMERGATISACGLYRYTLWRRWGPGRAAMFVGLNPSTADALQDDPTIRRCIGFARSWGYDALVMTNLFAWRATEPADMLAAADPVGPDNDAALRAAARDAAVVVAAWGVPGTHLGRDAVVRSMLPRLHYLRMTKGGHPAHPLYLPADLRPIEWPAAQPQDSRPSEELQVMQVMQDEPAPAPCPQRLYGQVTLHDGRQVDSGSQEWRRECLARHLLTLEPLDRHDWLAGWPPEAAVEMRLLMGAVKAARRGGV